MADEKQQDESKEEELDNAIADASSDTVKLPHEAESEPANTEGSEAQRP